MASPRHSVLCLGECLVDLLPSGERAGGAPANVAFHLANLRAVSVALCSRVGDDGRGRGLRQRLSEAGVATDLLTLDDEYPTGVVRVRSEACGPAYDIVSPAAWDHIAATAEAMEVASEAGVLVYGTLAQRHPDSRSAIRALVAKARASGALLLADLNLRAPFFDEETVLWTLRHCHVLKLNSWELRTVSEMLGARGDDEMLFEGLVREFGLSCAVLTCGAEGVLAFEHGCTWRQPAVPVGVRDTVGAGDAVTAILAASLALGVTWSKALPFAAEVAAFVVSQEGAMAAWPAELADRARQVFASAA